MSTAKAIEVTIMGQSYVLTSSDEGEQALLEAVSRVDREMSAIRDGGRIRARERIAVLAAVKLAYALVAAERSATEAGASAVVPTPVAPSVDDARIAALVARIDQALGADGQLI